MLGYLRAFLIVGLLAGISAGLVSWGAFMLGTTPLILEAEVYENAAPGAAEASAADGSAVDGHEHEDGEGWTPADGWERNLYTLGAEIITGVGYALLLTAAIVFFGKGADWRRGLLWGLAGFASFTLAPSLGLPPELPGSEAAPLVARQAWWLGTVAATAAGLFAAARLRSAIGYGVAVVLIALPHIIGAPKAAQQGGLAPESLEHQFIAVAIGSALIFWLVLGALTGAFFKRYAPDAGTDSEAEAAA